MSDCYAEGDAMAGPMEPRTPCDWMPTRPCVFWALDGEQLDPGAGTDDEFWATVDRDALAPVYPVEQCAPTCWRYSRPVIDGPST